LSNPKRSDKQVAKNVGVLLSGCGFLDGSEIHETVLTLLFLDQAGAKVVCMAPSGDQQDVMDHQTAGASGERRKMIAEAARISRGNAQDVDHVNAKDLDALILPGGYGAAKNLCDFAVNGAQCTVHPGIARLIRDLHKDKKPMGFICIAPVIAAKVLGSFRPELTIGHDKNTAAALEKMGARHIPCDVDQIAVDPANKLVSTPAYMLGPTISRVAFGIEKLVSQIMAWTQD
jgi:enhancing lycopene biosynthesis protein 2